MYFFTYNPQIGIFILRVVLGIVFMIHGYPKIFKNFSQFSAWLESMAIRPGKFWAVVVGITEFFGGSFLVLGILVPIVSIGIMADMFVAMLYVKWGKVKFIDQNGWELDFVYLILAVVLFVSGAGAFALMP